MREARSGTGEGHAARPRARPAAPPARRVTRDAPPAPPPPPVPLWSQELVLVCCVALLLGPLLLAVVGSYYLFVLSGALLAAAVLVLLTAALPAAAGAGGDAGADAAWLSPGTTVGVMLGSLVAGALIGGRGWAAPAVLLPVGCGWLALQAGLADHGDGDRSAVRGPHPNLQIAYVSLVVAVLLPLLAWFAGVI